MAGMIGAQDNGAGIKGINPDAEIYSIQILDENNQSTLGQVIAGIHKAIELDCDIINMSFGTTVDSQLLHDAIKEADKNGILMIAAAGNTEGGAVEYPAAYDEVLAVGASDTTGNKLDGSSDGEEIEIFAPGDQVVSTGLFGGSIVLSGTSIAVAQVTGAASLLWSMNQEKEAGFIRSLMTNTAQSMEDNGVSDAGLLDIENAIAHYDTLEYTYNENVSEYEKLQEAAREAEEFLDVKLVNGMWGGSKHAEMAGYVAYGLHKDYISLMERAAQLPDHSNYKDAKVLHGSNNYIRTLKFLYNCATYLRNGTGIEKSLTKASKDIGINNDEPSDVLLVKKVRMLLNADIISDVPENSKEAKYFKVMGFAMHLVGDTYAHRTIVPTYTIKGSNPTVAKQSTFVSGEEARFGTGDFLRGLHEAESDATLKKWAFDSKGNKKKICMVWECFQRAVKLGVMEFKDIKHFTREEIGPDTYEDNAKFCMERYVEAQGACECVFVNSYDREVYEGLAWIYPTYKNVKLNNLKGYAEQAGQDTSWLTSKEWAQISTPKEY